MTESNKSGDVGAIELRLATRKDERFIVPLFERSFARKYDLLRWKWFSQGCPYGKNRTYVAVDADTGELAGSYSLLPTKVAYNGRIMNASLCNNVNTAAEYRKRGIFVNLGRFALEREREYGSQLSLGTPAQSEPVYAGHMRVGWKAISPLPFLVKYRTTPRPFSASRIDGFNEQYDRLLLDLVKKRSFFVLKDRHYMKWRFLDRPDCEYTTYASKEDGEMTGFAVLKRYHDKALDVTRAHIIDMHATTKRSLEDLLCAAESFAADCDELNLWTIDHDPFRDALLGRGFHIKGKKEYQGEYSLLGTKQLLLHTNYGQLEPLRKTYWWFCLGDNDVY